MREFPALCVFGSIYAFLEQFICFSFKKPPVMAVTECRQSRFLTLSTLFLEKAAMHRDILSLIENACQPRREVERRRE